MITDQAPYGPTDAVTRVLELYRETGLGGGRFTVELVTRMGFGSEVARRVIISLRMLELLDEEDSPTSNLIAFKQASSNDYRAVLADQLYDVYSTVFAVTDKNLAEKTPAQIEDAFRTFRPDSLRKRMVTLFLGLCEYAGIVTETPKARPGPKGGTRKPGERTASQAASSPVRRRQSPPPPPRAPRTPGDSYTVELKSGGKVTLTVAVQLFDLTTEDRKFVIDLIDALKGYGTRPALTAGGAEKN